jgi:hypothetical protein
LEAYNAEARILTHTYRKKSALLRSSVPPSAQKQHQNDESQNPDNCLKRCGVHGCCVAPFLMPDLPHHREQIFENL